MFDNVRILFMDTVEELEQLVKKELKDKGFTENNFVKAKLTRFGNGEAKAELLDSVRGKRLYIITDVCNHRIYYSAYGEKHLKTPDEHFADLKRVIAATTGNAIEINVIETILYESRQHKRKSRESLDCALALQELERMKVNCITTFDAHNVDVCQAIPLTSFDNIIPTKPMLLHFINKEIIDYDKLLVISPDEGAMGRARFYAGMLNTNVGMFYKRRDYSKIDENGKNPIEEHVYLGKEIDNGEYLIIDDMISSGGSIIDILEKLKTKKPNKVWVMATFGLFTEGTKMFDEAYENGLLTKLYCSNFTDIPDYIKEKPWFERVDCSETITEYLMTHINHNALSPLLNSRTELFEKVRKLKRETN